MLKVLEEFNYGSFGGKNAMDLYTVYFEIRVPPSTVYMKIYKICFIRLV